MLASELMVQRTGKTLQNYEAEMGIKKKGEDKNLPFKISQ